MILPHETAGRKAPVVPDGADTSPQHSIARQAVRRRDSFSASLPVNLNLHAVTRSSWVDYAGWIVHTVIFPRFVRKGTVTPSTFVKLGSKYGKRFVPERYWKGIMADLKKAGVLECDDKYRPGSKCYYYRLGEAYRTSKIRVRELRHPQLLQNINREEKKKEVELAKGPLLVALRDYSLLVKPTADAPHGEDTWIDKLLRADYHFKKDKYGRVHNCVTCIARENRQFIRQDGKGIVSVDVSTCQPLLLALYLRAKSKGKGREEKGGGRA